MWRGVRRDESGQALVETALSLALLVFLLIGGADLARAYAAQVAVLNAARAGAEAGAMKVAATFADMESYAIAELSRTPAVDPASATATASRSTGAGGESLLTVRVRYTFRTLVPWPLVPSALALDRSAVFREP